MKKIYILLGFALLLLIVVGMKIVQRNNWSQEINAAVKNGDLKTVEKLLNEGVNVNSVDKYGYNILMTALGVGEFEMASFLIDKGADVHHESKLENNPLEVAIRSKNVAIVRKLVENGANIHEKWFKGMCPVVLAAIHSPEILEFLIEKDVDVNVETDDGMTALAYAVDGKDLKPVKLLVDNGAKINKQDIFGTAPIHLSGSYEIMKYLISKGADVNIQENMGHAPLNMFYGRPEYVELLLDNGADIDLQRSDGETPLHKAIRKKRIESAKLLIKRGANVFIKDHNGRTPLDVAYKYEVDEDLIDLLKRQMEK
ncbi:ankyrin repeat domain-containing protein [Desulfoluna sp.]|uniref:ankyrin repeat domain-containing protein n=1 Tax=Desulfoluna sp. TaxID=2045199 RepID=UPI002602535A|nr:ankyrin repeat domain-containing protein [Desulfoluna sp.]